MLLSIGMIVKNEAVNLRRCLDGLLPILTRVDSELIIADTGSTDGTVEIIEDFANKHTVQFKTTVLNIEWNDDFAEARNHTVRAARGEWFMYVDGDEFFEDTEELINFFNSGEYKHYNFATYQNRSYTSGNGSYTVSNHPRLHKLTPSALFESAIHEYIPAAPPRKDLNSYVRHVGYDYINDPEKWRRKKERNLTLLKKIYERDPSNLINIALIANELMTDDTLNECKEYLDIGMTQVRGDNNHPMFHFFYHALVGYYLRLDTPESRARAAETAREYLALRRAPSITSVDIYYYLGAARQLAGDYTEAARAYQSCYELIQEYLARRLDMEEAPSVVTQYANEPGLAQAAFRLAECYAGINENKTALKWFITALNDSYGYMQKVYPAEVLSDDGISGLTDEQRFVYHMAKANIRLQSGDLPEYLRRVKAALGCGSGLAALARIQLQLLKGL